MGIHMGVARGPLDELVEIRAGGRTAWSRDADGPVTASGRTTIYCPDLFGGDEKEGGLDGTLDVMMGESTQVPPSSLATVMPGLIPGFRDVTTLFYDGQISANNPYPKTWEIRGRRTTSGWQDNAPWYPEKATVWLGSGYGLNGIKAMNGAHIIYELNTNRSWGRGLPAGRIDVDSFTVAADTLYAEGFGLCLPWLRQESLADFQQRVLDHIGAACGPDPHTGKMRLRLIRDDYDPEALPLFTYGSGLLDVVQEETGAVHESINEIIVGWFDPVSGQARQTAPIQNLASIQSIGIRNTSIRDYSGCPTAELASRLAQRDLRGASPSLKRFKIRLDRRAYWLQPGDVFRIAAPDRGIGNVVLRAGDVREDWITDGTITVVALIDVFGLPATATVSAQPSLHVRPDYTPAPALHRKLQEVPYQQIVQQMDAANLELVSPLDGFVMACAVRPTAMAWSFRLLSRTAGADYQERGTGYWCPTGITTTECGPGADSLVLTDVIDLDAVVVGDAALWEDEIVRIDAIDHSTRTVTVGRACADTVPALHLAGSRIWFFDGPAGVDPTTWLAGELVDVKLLTTTGSGRLAEADAPANSITLARRQFRPYPPGKLRINGSAYPATIAHDALLSLAWAHRDRLGQADQLIDTNQGDIGPEAGTTYTLRIYGESNTLLRTVTGITGTGYAFTDEAAASGLGEVGPVETVFADDGEGDTSGWRGEIDHRPRTTVLGGWALLHDGTRFVGMFGEFGAGRSICTSVDGVAWVAKSPAPSGFDELLFCDGTYLAMVGLSRTAHVSSNLESWTPATTISATMAAAVIGGEFLRIDIGSNLYSSSTGTSWASLGALPVAADTVKSWWRFAGAVGGTTYAAFSYNDPWPGGDRYAWLYASADHATWTRILDDAFLPAETILGMATSGSSIIIPFTTAEGAFVARSTDDGETWTVHEVAAVGQPIWADGAYWMTVGQLYVMRSVAGVTWTIITVDDVVFQDGGAEGHRLGGLISDGAGTQLWSVTTWASDVSIGKARVYRSLDDGATLTISLPAPASVVSDTVVKHEGAASLQQTDSLGVGLGAEHPWSMVAGLSLGVGSITLKAALRAAAGADSIGLVLVSHTGSFEYGLGVQLDIAAGRARVRAQTTNPTPPTVTAALSTETWYQVELLAVKSGVSDTFTLTLRDSAGTLIGTTGPVTGVWATNVAGSEGYLRLDGEGHFDSIEVTADSFVYRLNNTLRIELESVRGGVVSHQKHNVLITRLPAE